CRIAPVVTARAGVRSPVGYALIRPRDAEIMIATVIENHVGPGRHMAGDTPCALRGLCVKMMRRSVETGGVVTPRAKGVSGSSQLSAMRVVAIRAGHSLRVHPALQKGSV